MFVELHRKNETDFTRDRKLSFSDLFILVLRKSVKSIQVVLNECFVEKKINNIVTASAFTQARKKMKHTAFIELNNDSVNTYYQESKDLKTFFGFRCVASDQSKIILPKSKEIENEFGCSRIKNGDGDQGRYNHSACQCYFDVLNNIALKASLDHGKTYEVNAALNMTSSFTEKDLLIYDRGYASYEMLATLTSQKKNFIIRFPKKSFNQIAEMFTESGPVDQIVKLTVPKDQKNNIIEKGLPQAIEVRFVQVILQDDKIEVLATSLLDPSITQNDFKDLYWLRWGVETFFGRIKSRLSLENFTGKTVESIKQDFWSTILISNLESMLSNEAEKNMGSSDCKYKQKVNKAVSFNAMKSMAFEIFYSNRDIDILLRKLIKLFAVNPVLKRPNKKSERRKPSVRRSLHYQKRVRKHVF